MFELEASSNKHKNRVSGCTNKVLAKISGGDYDLENSSESDKNRRINHLEN